MSLVANGIRRIVDRGVAKRNYASLVSGDLGFRELQEADPTKPKVLFITSNGAGMGHLTRCMAIARSGSELFESAFLTLSSSAPIVGEFGFPYVYFKSHKATDLKSYQWNLHFEYVLRNVFAKSSFDAVVFDGTWVYAGLLAALRRTKTKFIWLRRGLWKKGVKTDQVQALSSIVDSVITPADVADNIDSGPLAQRTDVLTVPAITLTAESELLDAGAAKLALGLDQTKRYVLIQLGAGNINDIVSVRQRVIDELRQLDPQLVPAMAISPLARSKEPQAGIDVILQRYPIAPYLRAFEFVVSAAGYNSIHEFARFRIPALIIPNQATTTDNQELRAQAFEEAGYGYAVSDATSIRPALMALIEEADRKNPQVQLTDFDSGQCAAAHIASLL